jgi:DNA polymerase III delta prime subunit
VKPADAVPFRSFLVIQSISRPILLTGEPGSGKTLAAYWIASRLKLSDGNMLEFHVKSDSRAKDRHARANRDPEIDVLSLVRSVSDREALDGSVGGSPIGSISASASVDRLSTRLPSAGSPARPGDALATLWVNRGAINQRQDDTAACGSADRLATSTMRTVRMKPGPHFTESLSIASGPIGPHSRACPKRSRQLSALFPGTERSARSWLNAERDTARDRFRPNLA